MLDRNQGVNTLQSTYLFLLVTWFKIH